MQFDSLRSRFALGAVVGLVAGSALVVGFGRLVYERELRTARADAATQVSRLFQSSLENAMLKRDLEGLNTLVGALGHQPGIVRVFITTPQGEVRFSSGQGLVVGERLAVDVTAPTTRFLDGPDGREVLRSINPVSNKPQCGQCHGPLEARPVNGVFFVDFDAAEVRTTAWKAMGLVAGVALLFVLFVVAGGWWFLSREVLGPTARISEASRRFQGGEWSTRVGLSGAGELATLGQSFDAMAGALERQVRELGAQREFLQGLIDAVPDGLRVIDQDHRVVLSNRAYRAMSGAATRCWEAYGRDRPCEPTLIYCPLHELRQHAGPVKVMHQRRDAAGRSHEVEITAARLDGGLIVESMRDLKEVIQHSHKQKLAELGQLAAGVAHEIHNPLASVRIAMSAALATSTGELTTLLETVDREIDRCVEVTHRLLRLSVPSSTTTELVDLDRVGAETVSLLHWEAERLGVTLRCTPSGDARVLTSDSDMRMVALNLAQNALHAMPTGGTLEVKTRRVGERVEWSFTDSGVGMSAETLARIFDAFFSKRADGQTGTGLGLSIVRTIVDNAGGDIDVQSALGRGSTFTVSFPAAREALT